MGDHSLIHTQRPWWRESLRLPSVSTLSARRLLRASSLRWETPLEAVERGDALDVTAAGSSDSERVWRWTETVLGDAMQGGHQPRELIALRYCGPVLGDERAEWIDLTADLESLRLVGALLGYLTGEDYSWAWAPSLLPETPRWEVA